MLKEGLFLEDGELIYYKNGSPEHAGVVRINGDIYYIGSGGKAAKGERVVHGEMTNGILKRGTYTFGDDCKLVAGSYIAPRKRRRKKRQTTAKKRSPRKFGLWERLKKMKHKKLVFFLAAVLVLLVALVWVAETSKHHVAMPTEPTAQIVLPEFTEDVLLCSGAAKMEYDGELTLKAAVEAGNPYRPFYFKYSLEGCIGTLFLGEREDFSDAKQYAMPENMQYVAIDNLKVDTTYHYKVIADGQEFFGSFHTAPATRFVYIPGLVNTRDIGGGVTLDGKKVKQGLLIRGVELDGLVNAAYFIPEDKLQAVKDTFGFVHDFDLRYSNVYSGTYTSRLGIAHQFYSSPQYGEIFVESRRESIKEIFSDLADPEKYPMYLHCTWGRDRTGTIVFLLQGLLNMSEEDMRREYRLTAYVDASMINNNSMDVIATGLEPYAGDTLQEKIFTFLTEDVGVTEEEIASIRSIFLEQ